MYDIEKRSTVLENAASFARLNAYLYIRSHNKMVALGYVHQNAVRVRMPFLEVQIFPRILMYDWDP